MNGRLFADDADPPTRDELAEMMAYREEGAAEAPEGPESTPLTIHWTEAISQRGRDFIIGWETGGRDFYEQVIKSRPVWPAFASGVTIGCGYDLGYHTAAEFEADWSGRLPRAAMERLARTIGFRTDEPGRDAKVVRAKALIRSLSDIAIPWDTAIAQFDAVKMPKLMGQLYAALDNLDRLHPHGRAALLSLVFNRGGGGFTSQKDRFREMREIRRLMTAGDFAAIPDQLRAMQRVWGAESSLAKRRRQEADLFEAGLGEDELTAALRAAMGAAAAGILEGPAEPAPGHAARPDRAETAQAGPGGPHLHAPGHVPSGRSRIHLPRGTAMQTIDRLALEAMLMNPEVPDSAIRPYLRLDPLDSQAFRPSVIANSALVTFDETESAMALASLNGVSRWRRQMRYAVKITGWTGLKAVAEGDSWFQYPFLIEDVIDHLFDDWAIYCVGAAGDLLQDMARQDEVTAAVLSERPDLLLLSGGGNDLLGGGQLARYLKPHAPGMSAADHVTGAFDDLLARILGIYADLVERALTAGAKRVVCHGYDYAIPNGGAWLGRPMLKLGITDRGLQRDIIRVLIDRLHDGLRQMAQGFGGRVVAVDCRASVPDGAWYDELHPTSQGFAGPANLIRFLAESDTPEAVSLEGLEMPAPAPEPRPLPVADEEAVLGVLAMDEETLLTELGRRQALLEVTPDVAESLSLAMSPDGTEAVHTSFLDLGRRLVDRLNRELYRVLCGAEDRDKAEREKLKASLKLSEAAMIGGITTTLMAIGTPPFIAPLAATMIVKSGVQPAWEETCRFWGERLGVPGTASPEAGAPAPGG